MDNKALFKLSYGLYIISSRDGNKDVGCVINTLQQVTSNPAQLSIAINKDNFTQQVIAKSGVFAGSVLLADVDMNLIRTFGFQSSKDVEKFADVAHRRDANGIAFPTEGIAARFSCKVVNSVDSGTHVIYIGEITDAETLSEEQVMTYTYYHQVKNGLTPPKAPSYQEEKKSKGWRCTVCGYIYEGDNLPEDYICPLCKAPASKFERIE